MAHLLRNLKINRVATVDRGAGDGVRVVFWKRGSSKAIEGMTAETMATIAKSAHGVDGVAVIDVAKAIHALDGSVLSIAGSSLADDVATTKLDATFKQFTDHLTGLGMKPEAALKMAADVRAAHPSLTKGDDTMTPEEMKKLFGEEIAKATKPLSDIVEKQAHELSVLKMTPLAKAFYDGLGTDDLKKAFAAKKPADQDDEAQKAKTAKSAIPDELAKALAPIMLTTETLTKRNVELETTVKSLTEAEEVKKFEKRAADLGLPVEHGAIMRKAYAGDKDAIEKHDAMLKGLVEQVRTGKVFEEFGKANAGGTGATAYDRLVAKAEEIRKAAPADAPLTKEQAFAKAYTDPANAELAQQNKRDEMSRRRAAA